MIKKANLDNLFDKKKLQHLIYKDLKIIAAPCPTPTHIVAIP